ncbi:L-lactate dehydrogenase [Stieleria sp. TO1_6]|uniref:L-lactate dehydrogenase n=1 Tax=Stieleria tagensis TaxID=2956795 RepID=UPI00209AE7AE|nr:L-lactate dehydrogenase [Stieleria tagensis]MCO8121130.1 L-lactate dehydrogenase [Stieleria tagensis]
MKVSVIGSGMVGSTAAYAMVMQGIGREIVMVDYKKSRAVAEASDIGHAVPFASPLTIRAGDYGDVAGSRVVILSCGVGQKPGETRLELLQRNADVFREVIPQVVRHAPDAILLVASNPVDIMTHVTTCIAAECGVPTHRVLGSGTTLDTARFRTLLGQHFGVDSRHVHAHVIGEHGDSEVLTWSLATIAGLPLDEYSQVCGIELGSDTKQQIDRQVRGAAYQIIEGKGATYFGIGSALARIVDVLLHDQRAIMTVCSRISEVGEFADLTISMPHLLGGDGVLSAIPMTLDNSEQLALDKSASVIHQAIESLGGVL